MKKFNIQLPQLNGKTFLTDGGMETTLIFHQGIDLPHFASFDLLSSPEGEEVLRDYYVRYLQIAKMYKMGFILESPTWRASSDWGYLMGYDAEGLRNVNIKAIELLRQLKEEYEDDHFPIIISGCIGPRGDGYSSQKRMNITEARHYHREQIITLHEAGSDLITSFTINYSTEALGIALAAKEIQASVVIGVTVETDGRLPSGESLERLIRMVDLATTNYPVYYMINCAHPSHFEHVLSGPSGWQSRIMAIRANASCKSHAELDESESLDPGDKHDLAKRYRLLRERLPNLNVIGGCCGTDHTHIEEICQHWNAHVV